MALLYQPNGNLFPGIHEMNWTDFVSEFGYNSHRNELILGLKKAIDALKSCGCKAVFIDGSFTTKKIYPNDFDACWDPLGVDLSLLLSNHPVFFDFSDSRKNQKAVYKGELFPMTVVARPYPKELYLDFFQHDKDDFAKGIICLRL